MHKAIKVILNILSIALLIVGLIYFNKDMHNKFILCIFMALNTTSGYISCRKNNEYKYAYYRKYDFKSKKMYLKFIKMTFVFSSVLLIFFLSNMGDLENYKGVIYILLNVVFREYVASKIDKKAKKIDN